MRVEHEVPLVQWRARHAIRSAAVAAARETPLFHRPSPIGILSCGLDRVENESTEARMTRVAERVLDSLGLYHEREYKLVDPDGNNTWLRVDLCAWLPNGHLALIEVKAFDGRTLSPLIDAIDQAASYANVIKYPVFIGPIDGTASQFSAGRMDNALGALHLLAGRLNVGFLGVNHSGSGSLVLRGQNVISDWGTPKNFDSIFRYVTRVGSKQVRE